ncbi:MAG: N-acetylmannosamine-6-phosphate 2-epimerase [Candidatus Eremiobacteraeota bacterium]|nr:N-acetylmannosamine-6-phosphate 2-epimerase [Candidatus Eremiobacteraeota bacterium]MBV9055426.1 N-acetylmannosamine-6-phosphate 2-epimerase [Candidatus Eremiobacteraeota bacterium]MBV9699775.1 N-acetylmannosamine-6-phosphate 2-epimerase [Candidatus Eremiobacteraeota bacterium]
MSVLDELRGGLIVSAQAWAGSALDDPRVIAAMARAAQDGGAVAVRVAGSEHLAAVRRRVEVPIVALIKREYPGFEPYITPTFREVTECAASGAEIVAFDATERARPDGATVEALIDAIHRAGCLAMADCATLGDAAGAVAASADVVATTLCGYTPATQDHPLPAFDVVAALHDSGAFTVCEGGIRTPAHVRSAFEAGADAVVVGTAITNVDWLVREFAGAARRGF